MRTLTFTRANLVNENNGNNQLVYTFPSTVQFKGNSIAIARISLYYSWFNISAALGNNTLSYTWTWDNAGTDQTDTYDITIPDGLYQVSQINEYLQYEMINNGTYWILNSSQYVYPFEFIVNATRYAVQLNTYLVPNALPSGATVPSNFPGWPVDPQNSVITTPADFCDIIGFSSSFVSDANVNDSYTPPAGSTIISKDGAGTISYLSTVAPDVQPNSSLFIQMTNISNNLVQNNAGIIYTITPDVGFGEQISESPPELLWADLIDGSYSEFRISLTGIDFNPIDIRDPNMTIQLVIK